MERRLLHWLAAALVALALHAGVALALLWHPPESGAQDAGTGGLQAGIGSPGGAPRTTSASVPETATATLPDRDAVMTQATSTSTAASPSSAASVPVSEAVAPEVAASEPVEPIRAQPENPDSRQAELSGPMTAPEQTPATTSADTNIVQADDPVPETARTAEPEVAKNVETDTEIAAETAAPARGGGQATGSGSDSDAGGEPGAWRDYQDRLRAWLQRHKGYPDRARMRNQEGIVVLRFTMHRDGRVESYSIESSSGYTRLDEEVQRMIRRADPLPSLPDSVDRDVITLTIPVQFSLR